MVLVYEDGSLQDLGLKFDNKMQNNIQQAKEVTLIHIIDGKKHKEQKINLIICLAPQFSGVGCC